MGGDRSKRWDVLLVGGGPAGLYAAQLLARRGVTVRVLEEHARIGEPVHCTGILGREALELPGVPGEAILGRPHAARFHAPGGQWFAFAGPPGEVVVVDRGAFDRGLAARAQAAGAEVTTGARAVALTVTRHGVTLRVQVGRRAQVLSSSICLLACGAHYAFQRALGWGGPPLCLGSAQTEVLLATDESLDLFFRPDTAPTGFAWVVPISRGGERRAKVGVMAAGGARRILQGVLGELSAAGRVGGSAGPVVARPLPLAPLARTYGDRVLAIGDAAGLVKPTTGGGIYYSLLSARWATETVVGAFERGEFSAAALAGYEETWRAHLGRELTVGGWFRRIAQRLTPGDLDALTELALSDGLLPIIRSTARFNWHHGLILQALRHPRVLQLVLRRLLAGALA